MVWTKIKLYLSLGVGLLIAALGLSTKYYAGKARKEKKRANKAESNLNHAIEVAEEDVEIDKQFRSRRADAKAEVDAGRDNPVFRDPNSMFDNKPDD